MALQLHWFLPSHGDGRDLAERRDRGKTAEPVTRVTRRRPDLAYLAQVAGAADRLGFAGMLTPIGLFCEDPWVVASALAARTERLKFMIALRPGLISPLLAAQMAATFQRISGDRLLLNVVTGGDPDEQRRYGDRLDHDGRYARTAEFLRVLSGVWAGRPYDFDGEHYRVEAALLTRPPGTPPTVFLGGSSESAQRVACDLADVYLAWGEPPGAMEELFKRVRGRAEEQGRTVRLGTRFNVIARDTAREAWAEADRLVSGLDPRTIEAAQRRFRRTESEGQRRMAALHGGSADRLVVHPNIWMGIGLVRPGAGATLVGSYEEVAERIAEYHAIGVDHLILSGQPHLEEAYSFGEGVMPLLRREGLLEEA
ncbi:LLM class flavin-dependent oxidoreductase [Sphaerimonospora mesophila]|uniref:LLM class flavin-dependent oxidoreductase n=1 Tax=Sphaerimonospora mesophila TaxID=37483 RepID=UPI0006E30FF5